MEIQETINLNGTIKIGDKVVAQANATISSQTGAQTSYNESINDHKLYVANKVECRAQFDEFQIKVRDKEDALQLAYPSTPPELPVE